jgi:hypothetical protein
LLFFLVAAKGDEAEMGLDLHALAFPVSTAAFTPTGDLRTTAMDHSHISRRRMSYSYPMPKCRSQSNCSVRSQKPGKIFPNCFGGRMARKPERAVAEEVIGDFSRRGGYSRVQWRTISKGDARAGILHNRWLTSGSGGGQFDGADEK